jgi:endonuclease-3
VYNKLAMAVDTHVFRVAERIGLTTNAKNPLEAERQLVKFIPEDKLPIAHHWLILHGRYICTARSPKCTECPLTSFCKYFARQRKQEKTS